MYSLTIQKNALLLADFRASNNSKYTSLMAGYNPSMGTLSLQKVNNKTGGIKILKRNIKINNA